MTKIILNFETARHGLGGGLPILKTLWERFGFSQIFADIDKRSGATPWKILFAYAAGFCILPRPLINLPKAISASRFLQNDLNWLKRSTRRIQAFCSTQETGIHAGNIAALDDTKVEHSYGKKIPFLCWLFDNLEKKHLWCLNLVSTLIIRKNGLVSPLFWRIWVKQQDVTKTKRSTRLYMHKENFEDGTPWYQSINPSQLLAETYQKLLDAGKSGECVAISILNIFMKLPKVQKAKNGKDITKATITQIAAVATLRLPEDISEQK